MPTRSWRSGFFITRIEGDRLQAGMLDIGLEMVLQVLPHAGQVMDHRDAELRADDRPAPMPDSIRICGELMAPPATITSRRARAIVFCPAFRYSTPTARRPSKRMRVVSARVRSSTLPRRIAGRR